MSEQIPPGERRSELREYLERISRESGRSVREIEWSIINNYEDPPSRLVSVRESIIKSGKNPFDPESYEGFNNPVDKEFYEYVIKQIEIGRHQSSSPRNELSMEKPFFRRIIDLILRK